MFNLSKTITSAKAKAMQSVRDNAKQIAKQEGEQWMSAIKQQGEIVVTGEAKPQQPSTNPQGEPKPENLFSNLKQISPEEQKQIQEQSNIRLQRLEEELKQLRMQRQQQTQEWVKQQQQLMHPEEAAQAAGQAPPKREIIIPTSKPKGPNAQQAAANAKKGSKEVGRQRST